MPRLSQRNNTARLLHQTMQGRVPTLKDVALRAGVSFKTVSRVVNGEAHVRPSTSERVRRAAAQLQYRPNVVARTLVAPQSYRIALLFDELSDNYLVNLQRGALEACERLHYSLLLMRFSYADPHLIRHVSSALGTQRPSGVVLTPPLGDHVGLLRALDAQHMAHATIAPSNEAPERAFVRLDDRRGMYDLVRYVIAQGHRRVAFISGDPHHGSAARRELGYRDALSQAGINVPRQYVYRGSFRFDSGILGARHFLSLDNPPTAIVAANDYMAAGVMYAAHAAGLRVPDQLSVTGYDDMPAAAWIYPGITTVRQPVIQMASGVIDCLRNLLSRRAGKLSAGPIVTHFPYEMIKRNSVAPPSP